MAAPWLPPAHEVRGLITEVVVSLGGVVRHSIESGGQLFLRALLAPERDVARGDRLKSGIVAAVIDGEVEVRPYVFREVCSNGAILAEALESRSVQLAPFSAANDEIERVCGEIRATVRACGAPEVFHRATGQIHSLKQTPAEVALQLLHQVSAARGIFRGVLVNEILRRFHREGDDSAYGVWNAVTSTARDQRDPERQWRLEELGGSIPALVTPPRVPRGTARAARLCV